MTDEPAVHRQLMRLHGFGIMTIILTDQANDRDIVLLALECLEKFKSTMTYRNKVEDSGIEDLVKVLAESEDQQLAAIAKDLLDFWSTLEMSYRIPRVQKLESLDEEDNNNTTTIADHEAMPRRHYHADDFINTQTITFKAAPIRPAFFGPPIRHRPPPPPPPPKPVTPAHVAERSKLDAIIAMAAASAQPVVTPPAVETTSAPSRMEEEPRKRQKTAHVLTAEEEAKKEKRLTKLVGEVVVNAMSKYKDQMEHDTFKRYAKDVGYFFIFTR
jgi:histone-lysine N-methyltransferase SETD2